MALTFAATLLLPLQYAVLIGMAFSILLNAVHQANNLVVREWILAPGLFPEERPAPKALPSGQLTMLQIYGSLFFAGAKSLEDLLPAPGEATRAVVALALRGTPEIGSTFIAVLRRYADALKARDCRLMLVGVDPTVRAQLARTGLLRQIGEDFVFVATPQLGSAMNKAAAAARDWIENPTKH